MSKALALSFAVSAFNLHCVGEQKLISVEPPVRIVETYDRTYRIDLDRMEWCAGDCSETLDVESATERGIVLFDSPNDSGVHKTDLINRETGAHFAVISGEGFAVAWSGKCSAQPFTNLPAKRKDEKIIKQF